MQNILHTVDTRLVGDREFLAFSDGHEVTHIEVEDPMRNFEDVPTLDHTCLTKEQAIELRTWLNGLDL